MQIRNGLCNSLLLDPADMAVEDVLALHGAVHLPKVSLLWAGWGKVHGCGGGWGAGNSSQECRGGQRDWQVGDLQLAGLHAA